MLRPAPIWLATAVLVACSPGDDEPAAQVAAAPACARDSLRARLERAGLVLLRTEYVLTTPLSLAIARLTYCMDDVGRLPLGWLVKYPAIAVAGSLGILASRASERVMGRTDEGLTLIAEAAKPT